MIRHRAAPLDQLDPRTRLLGALGFSLLTMAQHGAAGLAALVVAALMLAALARLSPLPALRRVLALEGFLLLGLLTLPFAMPGEPAFSLWGWPASWTGLARAGEIMVKAAAAALALLALVGTVEPVALGRALTRLGAPDKLVHLYLFTLRYLDVLQREYRRLRLAMQARAFTPGANRHTWRVYGWLFGMLMVRSIERAERVVAAMRCRGFDGRLRPLREDAGFRRGDGVFVLASTLGAALLLVSAGRW